MPTINKIRVNNQTYDIKDQSAIRKNENDTYSIDGSLEVKSSNINLNVTGRTSNVGGNGKIAFLDTQGTQIAYIRPFVFSDTGQGAANKVQMIQIGMGSSNNPSIGIGRIGTDNSTPYIYLTDTVRDAFKTALALGDDDISDIGANKITGTISVEQGGTGKTTLTSGAALIGAGTNAVTTRDITNNTLIGGLGYTPDTSTNLVTLGTIANFNGSYDGINSHITKLGTIEKGVWNGSAIPISCGGTGAATADLAWSALGGGSIGKLNSLSDITTIDSPGTLRVAYGGTGKTSITKNAILAGNISSTTGAINTITTASGALFATAANGTAKFGILPVGQGGTGATGVTTFTSINNAAKGTYSDVALDILGPFVQIKFKFTANANLSTYTTIGTIPSNYCPKRTVIIVGRGDGPDDNPVCKIFGSKTDTPGQIDIKGLSNSKYAEFSILTFSKNI